ncbi:MAG: TFIIB-type zinc ribbon-containing protein [Nitrososphaeria archaeon]
MSHNETFFEFSETHKNGSPGKLSMPVACPDCGQPMIYEPATKMYICKRCGLYVNYNQLTRLIDQKKSKEKYDPKKEYLNWWLGEKK